MTIDENFDLKGIMKNYLLSQKDVGKIVGVSRQFIGSVLSGKKSLSPEKKKVLLDYLSYNSKYELETSVDYLRIRLKTLKWFEVIEGLLLMDSNLFNIDVSSMHNYNMSMSYGSIRILRHSENIDMGTLVEFNGGGCREFEQELKDQNRTWKQFFQDCFFFSMEQKKVSNFEDLDDYLKFTRLDLATDEMYSKKGNYDLRKLYDKMLAGQIQTPFRQFSSNESFLYRDGEFISTGLSLYFGSRKSKSIYINFYEKDKEQSMARNLFVDEIHELYGYKNRYEIRLFGDKATQVIFDFWYNDIPLQNLAGQIISHYLDIKDDKGNWDIEWLDVFGSDKSYGFVNKPREVSYDRTLKWLDSSVFASLKRNMEIDRLTGSRKTMELFNEKELDEKNQHLVDSIVKQKKERAFYDNFDEMIELEYV